MKKDYGDKLNIDVFVTYRSGSAPFVENHLPDTTYASDMFRSFTLALCFSVSTVRAPSIEEIIIINARKMKSDFKILMW